MDAEDLLMRRLADRDYSGSKADVYAQTLETIHHNAILGGWLADFYKKLSGAEKQGAELKIKRDSEHKDELYIDDVITV